VTQLSELRTHPYLSQYFWVKVIAATTDLS